MSGIFRKLRLSDHISEGTEVPRGWGVVEYTFPFEATIMPIPLNLLVRLLLRLLYAMTFPRKAWWEKRLDEADARGYQRGHDTALAVYRPNGVNIFSLADVQMRERAAYSQGRADLRAEIEKRIDARRNPPEEPVN